MSELFKQDVGGSPAIPVPLILPAVLVVSSLALDMLHYLEQRKSPDGS